MPFSAEDIWMDNVKEWQGPLLELPISPASPPPQKRLEEDLCLIVLQANLLVKELK